jgi:hypothetical protein
MGKVEAPDSNPAVETLDRVFAVLKVHPEFDLRRSHHV